MKVIKDFIRTKIFLSSLSFIVGIIAGYTIGFFDFRLRTINILWNNLKGSLAFLSNFTPSPVFLSDVVVFEGVLIGVAIPISLQVVTRAADRYKDDEIAQFFVKEPLYWLQYMLLLSNIALAILLRFLNISNLFVLSFFFFWLIVNIVVFYAFIRRVQQYATNIDKLLLRKLRRHVKAILEK